MNSTSTKCVIFARVSSREQEETGYSLPAQEKLLADYSAQREFKTSKVFSISESASGRLNREKFDGMLDYATKNNINAIICEKVDRLTRNLKDAVSVDEWIRGNPDREVHFVKENCILNSDSRSNEKFIWNIKVSVAQYYVDNLSEEVKKGQKEKISQGWLPTKPPLGYKTVGEKGHKIHLLDNATSQLVRKMFELYATGEYSVKRLSDTMYEEGLRTRTGSKLAKSRLHQLLTDPFYYGRMRWKGEIYEGKQEPIISKELFESVQTNLRRKGTPKYNKHFYLFKGIIHCVECQGLVTWEKQKGTVYGHCNQYHGCSKKKWYKEAEVEQEVVKALSRLQVTNKRLADWIHSALKESHQDEIKYRETACEQLKKRYTQAQSRLDRLYDDRLDGRIEEGFYQKKFTQYTTEKEHALEAQKRHSEASNKYFELGVSIYDLSQKSEEIYHKATAEQKRQLISFVFEKMEVEGTKLILTYSKPFEVLSAAIEATNSSKALESVKSPIQVFELVNGGSIKEEKGALDPARSELLRRLDSNQ